ncbi:hypothetical protein [Zhongshania sp.]|uniref:hypothetical protein n=1 Tax=Zhongshania sp. TaxID=1971902 RepID=UPI00356446B4
MQKNYSRQYIAGLGTAPLIAIFFSNIAACQSPVSGLNLSWSAGHAIAEALSLKTPIASIRTIDGDIRLQASDFAPYPNREFESYYSYWQFLHRQQQLYLALRAQHVQFTTVDGDTIAVSTERCRSVGNLPLHFWQGILVAIAAWYLGMLVFYGILAQPLTVICFLPAARYLPPASRQPCTAVASSPCRHPY